MQLRILLSSPESGDAPETLELRWNIHEDPTSKLWLMLAGELLESSSPIYPRFTGFMSGVGRRNKIQRRLNWCIDTINENIVSYQIKERADGTESQDFANAVHHHFEILAGPVTKPTKYLKWGSTELRHAIFGLNHCIHDLELHGRNQALVASENPGSPLAAIIIESVNPRRLPLTEKLSPTFTLETAFGDLVLHYSQIGKTWLEVFLYEDADISPEAILPLGFITGEFDVFFGEYKPSEQEQAAFMRFLRERGLDPADPSLRLGYCKVGSFQRNLDLSDEGYRALIGTYERIAKIELLDAEEKVAISRDAANDYFLYCRPD